MARDYQPIDTLDLVRCASPHRAQSGKRSAQGDVLGRAMACFRKNAILFFALAYAGAPFAQESAPVFEPLPKDPKERIHYGEYYDPEEYAKCWEKWVKTGDPRGFFCEKFRERLEPLDPNRRDWYGEFYDPKKYHECRARVEARDTQCEYLRLRRKEAPEFWPYPDVPPVKWPEPPKPVYRWWMSAERYFDALCKSEAGEFIFKTVDDVEGVYAVRPRRTASTEALRDRYVLEDPYGFTGAEAENPALIFLGPKKYRFFEVPVAPWFGRKENELVARFFGYDDRSSKSLKREYDTKLKSRYGYTWREIRRPHDRENAILGGELIVLDLRTNEILGIRRGFLHAAGSRYSPSGLTWEAGEFCPLLSKRAGIAKDYDASYSFVARVLKPEN